MLEETAGVNIEKQEIPDGYKGPPIFCSYTKLIPISQIKPNPKNPNKHPRKQITLIQKILSGNGWRSPLVVSNLSGLLVKGEGRWSTAIQAGWSHVPVDFQDYLSPALEEADLLADNEIALLAEMDKRQRLDMLEGLNSGELPDMELVGIPLSVLEEMFNESRNDEEKVLYPMAAQLHEKYDYVLVFTTNETDRVMLHEMTGVEKQVSYKMSKEVGLGRSVTFKQFVEAVSQWKGQASSESPRSTDTELSGKASG